jgi:putative endonuclease
MSEHFNLGKQGEEIALGKIRGLGYEIIECNWRFHPYEIDIIARDGHELVFAEVKTRSDFYYGNPEEFVGKTKQKRIIKAANHYIESIHYTGESRFDVVGVCIWEGKTEVIHIINAFYP